ncbi:hypothetical protein F4825DRAFT_474468 [Nemania diffusa]|nr:hypothetical protein F4825DRAFT_474468 [Nemania diffusa]
MPPGERSQRQAQGMSYGASVAEGNVEFATDANTEAQPGTRDRALLDKLKDALKPGDARRLSAAHDGRHRGADEEAPHPGHRDYEENPHPRRGSVLDELGERGHARESPPRRGSVLDELGERARGKEGGGGGGGGGGRRGSIFEHMPFGLGQQQQQQQQQRQGESAAKRDEHQRGGGGGGGGGVMDSVKGKTGGAARHQHYRDSTDMSKADERHLPGAMYHNIRDDLLK